MSSEKLSQLSKTLDLTNGAVQTALMQPEPGLEVAPQLPEIMVFQKSVPASFKFPEKKKEEEDEDEKKDEEKEIDLDEAPRIPIASHLGTWLQIEAQNALTSYNFDARSQDVFTFNSSVLEGIMSENPELHYIYAETHARLAELAVEELEADNEESFWFAEVSLNDSLREKESLDAFNQLQLEGTISANQLKRTFKAGRKHRMQGNPDEVNEVIHPTLARARRLDFIPYSRFAYLPSCRADLLQVTPREFDAKAKSLMLALQEIKGGKKGRSNLWNIEELETKKVTYLGEEVSAKEVLVTLIKGIINGDYTISIYDIKAMTGKNSRNGYVEEEHMTNHKFFKKYKHKEYSMQLAATVYAFWLWAANLYPELFDPENAEAFCNNVEAGILYFYCPVFPSDFNFRKNVPQISDLVESDKFFLRIFYVPKPDKTRLNWYILRPLRERRKQIHKDLSPNKKGKHSSNPKDISTSEI